MQEYDPGDILCVRSEEGELGSGSYGVVLLARHKTLGFIAVKCFPVKGGKGEKQMLENRIRQEIGLLQKSNHKNITRVHGWTKWPFAMGIVMQYYQGGNLRNLLLNASVKISLQLRLRMCAEIAEGLAYIHNFAPGKRMTHGDMKPENILVDEDFHCLIADFGGAKIASATGLTTTTTQHKENNIQFTMIYAAPERLLNEHARPKWNEDVYSFGLIICFVLGREQPFEYFRGNVDQFKVSMKEGARPDLDPIEEFSQTLSEEEVRILDEATNIMKRCWDQDPSKRPQMTSVRDEFLKLLSLDYNISTDVAQIREQLGMSTTSLTRMKFTPIDSFNPETGKFYVGDAQNLVQPAATTEEALAQDTFSTLTLDDSVEDSVFTEEPGTSLADTLETNTSVSLFSTISASTTSGSSNGEETLSFMEEPEEVFDFFDDSVVESPTAIGDLNGVESLAETYGFVVADGDFSKRSEVKEELTRLILSQVDASPKQIRKFASQMRDEGQFVEAIMFYDLAAGLFAAQCDPPVASNGLVVTAGGMKKTCVEAAKTPGNSTTLVKFVIRLLDDISRSLEELRIENKKMEVNNKCRCVYYVSCLERLTENFKECENLLTSVIQLLNATFGPQSRKQPLHALCLTQLGFVYSSTSRYNESRKYLQDAIHSHLEVRYADQDTRDKNVTMCKTELQRIENM